MNKFNRKIHIIDKETGYCETCQKFEVEPEIRKLRTREEILSSSRISTHDMVPKHDAFTVESTKKALDESHSKRLIKYKRYRFCDCCKGKLGDKFKTCKLCESLYYIPTWCLLLTFLLYCGLLSSIGYLLYYYFTSIQFQTYALPCTTDLRCNSEKGLYCRSLNGTSQDFCNCPARSTANTCDCPSSYYWNGLQCSPVYAYGNGPCMADYACGKGLSCNQLSGLCTCPDTTPSWDSVSKSCSYAYKGCFFSCFNTTTCDFFQSDVILSSSSSAIYTIELDDCLNLCNIANFKYTHMQLSSGLYRCACSNSYNRQSIQLLDTECNSPCSLLKTSVSRCPKNMRHSSFQIGL